MTKAAHAVAAPAPEPGGKEIVSLDEEFARDADAKKFREGIDKGAASLPFLGILQGLSPQVQRGTPGYVEGAAPGRIFNSVTKELYDSVDVSVLRMTHTYCWWVKREEGGGFKGEEPSSPALDEEFQELWKRRDEKNRCITKDGLEMTDHRNFIVTLFRTPPKTNIPVVISMTKSQLREARNWIYNLIADSVQNNLQSEIWTLSTTLVKRKENSWYVWQVRHKERHHVAALYHEVRSQVATAEQHTSFARQLDPNAQEPDNSDM